MMKHPLRLRSIFISSKFSKRIFILVIGVVVSPLATMGNAAYSQSTGKEGNRAVGVVFTTEGLPFGEGEARVAMFRRDTIVDVTNRDGVYCVNVPRSVSTFQLTYTAPGYWGATSDEIASTRDPIKVNKITLLKKKPGDKAQLQRINILLKIELAIYNSISSAAAKKAMREELINFSNSIEIPPPDPISTLLKAEREMRINARMSVDATVVKMK